MGHPERKTAKWQRCDRERHIVDFNGAEQIQPVLEELSRVTGTAFVEVSVAEEDTTIQCSYAQAVDGIVLDTEDIRRVEAQR